MTQQNETQQEVSKLFKDILATERKATNTGARLSVLMHNAIKVNEVSHAQVKAFANGASKKQSNETLHGLCSYYSPDYVAAYDNANNKEIAKESRQEFDKQGKAIRKAMTRALLIAAWTIEKAPELVKVTKTGDIALVMGEDSETFSLRSAETNSKRFFNRVGQGTKETTAQPVAMSLGVAAQFVSDTINGTDLKEYSPQVKASLTELMTSILGVFGAEDAASIETIFKKYA